MLGSRRFADRRDAGRRLAGLLSEYAGRQDVVVLGLPRGGVPVAYEVAAALHAPLDVIVVRKLGVPGHQELAFGAVASGGVLVLNEDVVADLRLDANRVDATAAAEQLELERRERLYRSDRPPLDVSGRIALAVDDGLATGASMRAAIHALRERDPAAVVVAVPVAARQTCQELEASTDALVCVSTPEPFVAVGLWYRNFRPTSDREVQELLAADR